MHANPIQPHNQIRKRRAYGQIIRSSKNRNCVPTHAEPPSAYRSPIISNAHGGIWRTPPAYISAVRFLLDKSKYMADINSSMVSPMGKGHERRAMNVNENLRRQLSCASKRNHLLIVHTPSERKSLKLLVARGVAIEPIPGAFSLKKEYERMNPRARERARIKAIHKLHPDWTFCLYSAAIAHGLQVPHTLLDATHIAIAKGGTGERPSRPYIRISSMTRSRQYRMACRARIFRPPYSNAYVQQTFDLASPSSIPHSTTISFLEKRSSTISSSMHGIATGLVRHIRP